MINLIFGFALGFVFSMIFRDQIDEKLSEFFNREDDGSDL